MDRRPGGQYKGFVIVLLGAGLLFNCHEVKVPVSKIDITAEPRNANQLLFGFYPPESAAWCWTAREFLAALKPPDER